MPLNFTTGTTTYGAADPVVDWFATFEAWISVTVGWAIVAGAGTTNLVISSIGEGGLYADLFIHIWQVGTQIRGEVRNAAGTQETAEGGFLNMACRARYWITADLDCIVIVVPDGAANRDRILYLGIVEPVANTPASEMRHMVASDDDMQAASVLRNSAGVWDFDIANFYHNMSDNVHRCLISGSFPPFDMYADQRNVLAGQYKYVSGRLSDNAGVVPGDVITSVVGGATSEWTVFYGGLWLFAVLTGGAPPGAVADGANYNFATGVAANPAALIAAVGGVLGVAGGWVGGAAFIPGAGASWRSPGESGADDISICVTWDTIGANGYFYLALSDGGVNITTPIWGQMNLAWFPGTYRVAGDRDCVCFTITDPFNRECIYWLGKPSVINGAPEGQYYNIGCFASMFANQVRVLIDPETGNWDQLGNVQRPNQVGLNSNANAYDVATYPVWPLLLSRGMTGAGASFQPFGWMKYAMYTNGGGIARFDTITEGGVRQYTVLNAPWQGGAADFWAIRNA